MALPDIKIKQEILPVVREYNRWY